jgi:hypothetical protein
MTQHEVNTFSNAYLLGNEAAQAKPDSMGRATKWQKPLASSATA